MKSWRRSLAVLLLSGASVAGGFLGFDLVQNTQFARAEEKVQLTRGATVHRSGFVFHFQACRTGR